VYEEGEYDGLIEDIESRERAIRGWLHEMRYLPVEEQCGRRTAVDDRKIKFAVVYPYIPSWSPYPNCSYVDFKEKENWMSLATVMINKREDYYSYKKMTFLIDSSLPISVIGDHVIQSGANNYDDDAFSVDEWRPPECVCGCGELNSHQICLEYYFGKQDDNEYQRLISVELGSQVHFQSNLWDDFFSKVCVTCNVVNRSENISKFKKMFHYSKITRRQFRKMYRYCSMTDWEYSCLSYSGFCKMSFYKEKKGKVFNVLVDGILGSDSFDQLRPSKIIQRISSTHAIRDSRLGVLHILNM
jgi:hypothetical protein